VWLKCSSDQKRCHQLKTSNFAGEQFQSNDGVDLSDFASNALFSGFKLAV
jgi:hypothetical protein